MILLILLLMLHLERFVERIAADAGVVIHCRLARRHSDRRHQGNFDFYPSHAKKETVSSVALIRSALARWQEITTCRRRGASSTPASSVGAPWQQERRDAGRRLQWRGAVSRPPVDGDMASRTRTATERPATKTKETRRR